MELSQLEYFRTLCKCRSYTQTANKFGITQPAVSAAVKKLETELDISLVEKNSRNFTLTPAGQAILEQIEAIHDQITDIYNIAAEYAEHVKNEQEIIRLALPLTIDGGLTRSIYSNFLPAHPEFHVDILKMGPEYVVENIENESIDLGITCYDCQLPTLECQPLYKSEFGVYFSSDHEFNGYDCITPEMLSDQKVLLGRPRGLGRPIHKYFSQNNIHPTFVDIGAILPDEKVNLARNGAGVAILSLDISAPNRAKLFPPLYIEWAIMWRKGHTLTPNQKKLLRFIKDHFA